MKNTKLMLTLALTSGFTLNAFSENARTLIQLTVNRYSAKHMQDGQEKTDLQNSIIQDFQTLIEDCKNNSSTPTECEKAVRALLVESSNPLMIPVYKLALKNASQEEMQAALPRYITSNFNYTEKDLGTLEDTSISFENECDETNLGEMN